MSDPAKKLRGYLTQAEYKKACQIMGGEPINPIGECFDSVGKTFAQDVYGNEKIKICHGIIGSNMPNRTKTKCGHAWIEIFDKKDNITYAADTTWGILIEAKAYKKEIKCEYIVRYSKKEFMKLWIKFDHPGPFDEKIKEVQGDS